MKTTSYSISGNEQTFFLRQLNNSLLTLSRVLSNDSNTYRSESLEKFASTHNWDKTRLPKQDNTSKTLADLIERVRKEYDWFSWKLNENQPLNNRGYFDKIDISSETGLPWIFNFVELCNLKKEAQTLLERIPSYDQLSTDLATILIEDYLAINKAKEKSKSVQKQALKRSFLEKLLSSELIGWENNSSGIFKAKKIITLGAEELWNINGIKYLSNNGMFELYVIDIWQDKIGNLHFRETERKDDEKISEQFIKSLHFGLNNAPWFVLKDIDERFPNLHPVHVTRSLIGPLENKYRSNPKDIPSLNIVPDLLKKDPNFSLLRFSRQYTYAPNHKEKNKVIKQIIYRETWSDEIIITPTQYANIVNSSLLGTTVRVFEAGDLSI